MSKKIDDYLDLKIREESFGVSVEGIFILKTIETFNKNEYARFEEEIKCRTRVRIVHEIMKLVAREIEENGAKILGISDKALRSKVFDSGKGKSLMVLDERQVKEIISLAHFRGKSN